MIALAYAFHFGWRLFAEHLVAAFELEDQADVLDGAVSEVIAGLPELIALRTSSRVAE